MTASPVRRLVLAFAILALLLPKTVGAAALMLTPLQTVVICSGDRLITVTLGPDGKPIEVAEVDIGPCIVADMAATCPPPTAATDAPAKVVDPQNTDTHQAPHHRCRVADGQPLRGPPVSV